MLEPIGKSGKKFRFVADPGGVKEPVIYNAQAAPFPAEATNLQSPLIGVPSWREPFRWTIVPPLHRIIKFMRLWVGRKC